MSYPLYIVFGILPSTIWLLFYLRRDVHPESNSMIIKVFFFGMLAAIPTIFLELGISAFFDIFNLSLFWSTILKTFVGVALVEEIMKFSVVKLSVLDNAEFDEPIDTILYMIISALGFAASENILILFGLSPPFLLVQSIKVLILRFLGATFLHALCSGAAGYFLAISFLETKKRGFFTFWGISTAIFLHGLYNFSIMEMKGNLNFLIPLTILAGTGIFLIFAFKRLKKIKSVCKI